MKKTTGLIAFGILAFVLFFGVVSASISVTGQDTITLNSDKLSDTFELTSNGLADFTLDNNSFVLTDGTTELNLKITNLNVQNNVTNVTYLVNITNPEKISDFKLFESDSKEITFTIVNATNALDNVTKKIEIVFEKDDFNFCGDISNEANIDFKIEDFDVLRGYGDEDEWYLGDVIELELEIEPRAHDLEDIEIEWELYNTVGDLIDDGEFSVKDIDEDDTETTTFTITLDKDVEDFESADAVLYVKVTGEIDNRGEENDGDKSCNYDGIEADIILDDFVIANNVKIDNQKTSFDEYNLLNCDKEYSVSFETWNIGDKDQDDVYVEVYSDSLEIYESFEISEIDAFDTSRIFDFKFKVPEDLEDGVYYLNFKVYDEDGDIYENSDDGESKLTVLFKNEESCLIIEPTITADLYSEAIEGEEMIVKIGIRNDDVKSRTFLINPEDYQDWAVLKEISSDAIILDSGAREEVTLTLKIKDDVEGEKEFELNIFSDNKLISTQPVQVNVEAKEFLSGILDDIDWKIAGIILLNIILLVSIIVVAGKILKRK
ncbi:MAG TPA: putative S-layer protein [Candidatus Nanoarchaeia archaeon]|nr:putative S-layer protein [Candidatus Nanoarchaeia archaeon]